MNAKSRKIAKGKPANVSIVEIRDEMQKGGGYRAKEDTKGVGKGASGHNRETLKRRKNEVQNGEKKWETWSEGQAHCIRESLRGVKRKRKVGL